MLCYMKKISRNQQKIILDFWRQIIILDASIEEHCYAMWRANKKIQEINKKNNYYEFNNTFINFFIDNDATQ